MTMPPRPSRSPGCAASTYWKRLPRWLRRVLLLGVITPVLVIVMGAPVLADDGSSTSALSWINIRDSRGVPITSYMLSIDEGGVRHPLRMMFAFYAEMIWTGYQMIVVLIIWGLDWVLSFSWIDIFAHPALHIADQLHQLMLDLHIAGTLMLFTMVAAAIYMMRGKLTTGIFEALIGSVVFALAMGILSAPAHKVADPGGWLYQTRDLGMQIAVAFAAGAEDASDAKPGDKPSDTPGNTGENTTGDTTEGTGGDQADAPAGTTGLAPLGGATGQSADQLRKIFRQMLADTFIRKPVELVNFGKVLDGGKCEKTYTRALKDNPPGDKNVRVTVGMCDREAQARANDPNVGMVMSSLFLEPTGLLALMFAVVIGTAVIGAAGFAIWHGVKLTFTLWVGMLPGAARGALWWNISELITSFVILVFSLTFLAGYLLVIQWAFSTEGNPMKAFVIGDITLIFGIVIFLKQRSKLKKLAARIAAVLSQRPGGSTPTSLPQPSGLSPADMYYRGKVAAAVGQRALGAAGLAAGFGADVGRAGVAGGKAAAKPARNAWERVGWAGGLDSGGKPRNAGEKMPMELPGADHPALPAGGSGPAGQPNSRVKAIAALKGKGADSGSGKRGVLTRAAGTAVMAAATGGTSAVAGAVANQAKKEALSAAARQAKASIGPGSTTQIGNGALAEAHAAPSVRASPPPRVVPGEVVATSQEPPAVRRDTRAVQGALAETAAAGDTERAHEQSASARLRARLASPTPLPSTARPLALPAGRRT